jgi:hypothetical protein
LYITQIGELDEHADEAKALVVFIGDNSYSRLPVNKHLLPFHEHYSEFANGKKKVGTGAK